MWEILWGPERSSAEEKFRIALKGARGEASTATVFCCKGVAPEPVL